MVQANFDENKWMAGIGFDYKTSGVLGQFHMELPTEAGFPVNLQMGVTYTAKVNGTVTAGVESSVYKDVRGFMPPRKVKAGLFIDPQ